MVHAPISWLDKCGQYRSILPARVANRTQNSPHTARSRSLPYNKSIYWILLQSGCHTRSQGLSCVILSDTRWLLHTTCSVAVLLSKTVLLFALQMAWLSIKLSDWVVYRKRPGCIKEAKKSILCFLSGPIGNDSTRHAVSVGKLSRSYNCQP